VLDIRFYFVGSFIVGLLLGVFAMFHGIERQVRATRGGAAGRRFSLNLPWTAGFATVFGLAGYLLARYSTLGPAADLGLAAIIGAAGAVATLSLVAGWLIPAAKAEVVDERYVLQGCIARVIQVQAGGTRGVIAYEVNGVQQTAIAEGLDGARLASGEDVAIERVESGIAYVEPWSQVEARL
jgi:hypothetical protein